jgi:rhodanese-related sulfurtransferase
VHVVDLRPVDEAEGALGYIPGSVFVSIGRMKQLAAGMPDDLPVVLVSRTGEEAAAAALGLERSGMRYVAAMAGGLAGWRRLGFATSRDPAGVSDGLRLETAATAAEGPLSLEPVNGVLM